MVGKRSYDEACAMSHGLDLVGERWALHVVRELLLGPKRFTDLRAALPGASPNILVTRLRELEDTGIVVRRRLPPPAATTVYDLTGWGRRLEPMLVQLGRWAGESPHLDRHNPLGPGSLLLAMRTLFDPARARDWRASFTLRLGDDVLHVSIGDGQIRVGRGEAPEPDAIIETDAATLDAILWGGKPLGHATITGSTAAARRLLRLFPLPAPTGRPD